MQHVHHYDSVEQFIAETRECRTVRPIELDLSRGFVGRKFFSFHEALEAAGSTWAEGIELVEGMLARLGDRLTIRPTDRRRRGRWSEDTGDELDVDRLRSGSPFWRQTVRTQADAPETVTVLVDVAANGAMEPRELMWRGVVGLLVTDKLEAAGFRVKLVAVNNRGNVCKNHDGLLRTITLKHAAQPLDVATLTNAISSWFYRTIGFQGYSNRDIPQVRDEMGHRLALDAERPEIAALAEGGRLIVVQEVFDERDAERLAREILAGFGAE